MKFHYKSNQITVRILIFPDDITHFHGLSAHFGIQLKTGLSLKKPLQLSQFATSLFSSLDYMPNSGLLFLQALSAHCWCKNPPATLLYPFNHASTSFQFPAEKENLLFLSLHFSLLFLFHQHQLGAGRGTTFLSETITPTIDTSNT